MADQVEQFLAAHANTQFVCAGVDQWYWQMHDRLGQMGQAVGAQGLLNLACNSRLVDLRLFDQLLRYAAGEVAPEVQDLARLEATWSGAAAALTPPSAAEHQELHRLLVIYDGMLSSIAEIKGEATALVSRAVFFPNASVAAYSRRLNKATAAGRSAADKKSTRAEQNGPLGLGLHVRGALALSRFASQAGLQIDKKCIPPLLKHAWDKYRQASSLLAKTSGARDCFKWHDGQVAFDSKGFPVADPKKLRKWLTAQGKTLADQHSQKPPFIDDRGAIKTTNLERWSVWAACSPALFGCRQLVRSAGVARLADDGQRVKPSYEILPAVRSYKPDLTAYRKLRAPVFCPGEGKLFLAGRVQLRGAYCLAAISVPSGYAFRTGNRLPGLLNRPNALRAVARRLYVAKFTAAERTSFATPADAEQLRAEFNALNRSDRKRWLRLTNALLETAPLGLPTELLTTLLQNEYHFSELKEPQVRELVRLLGDLVARTYAGDVFLPQGPQSETLGGAGNQSAASHYRRLTLGGRPTLRASPAIVRQQQFLMVADEIMLEIAWAVTAAGYHLVALAGKEFLVEIEAEKTTPACLNDLERVATDATKRALDGISAPVAVRKCERW